MTASRCPSRRNLLRTAESTPAAPAAPAKRDPSARVALVTGASAGIGEAIARLLAAEGWTLVLVARREDALRRIAAELEAQHGVRVVALATDLAEPGAPEALALRLRRRRLHVDLLVNNAGVLRQGDFSALGWTAQKGMLALNVEALTAMIAVFAPAMLAAGHGRVLNVASIAAFQPVPSLATYAATKAYVLSLTESLAEEWRGRGVTATAMCPGITATDMLQGARAANDRLASLPGLLVGTADEVAAEGLRACMAGEVVVVPGVINRAAAVLGRATPRGLLRRLVGAAGRRFGPGGD